MVRADLPFRWGGWDKGRRYRAAAKGILVSKSFLVPILRVAYGCYNMCVSAIFQDKKWRGLLKGKGED